MNLGDMQSADMTTTAASFDVAPALALGEVVARVGAEVAAPLTAALNRIDTMGHTGRIDRPGLFALRDEIDEARRAGMCGQQIARLANGLVQQAPERLNLAQLLREILGEQSRRSRGATALGSRQQLAPIEIISDPSLVGTVLRATADWAVENARAPIDWRIEVQPWPMLGRLVCEIVHLPADQLVSQPDAIAADGSVHLPKLDTLDWLLLRFAAHLAGVQVQRQDDATRSTVTLRFPNTVNETLEGASAFEIGTSHEGARLVAGSQVLVLAARREARERVRQALVGHEVFIDYVPTVSAARDYCREGLPQAIIFESALAGEPLRALCAELCRRASEGDAHAPTSVELPVTLLEIMPTGRAVEQGSIGDAPVTRLGVDAVRHQLAPLLVMTLGARRR